MPQEHKKRGRRMKRKHGDGDDVPADASSPVKRRKSTDDATGTDGQEFVPLDNHDDGLGDAMNAAYPSADKPFFGMLDDEEQEYFKRADDMLEANEFGDDEERSLFLSNVWREAEGKELKIAQSQSCSRLTERLIQLSTPAQLKGLFQKFSGK